MKLLVLLNKDKISDLSNSQIVFSSEIHSYKSLAKASQFD